MCIKDKGNHKKIILESDLNFPKAFQRDLWIDHLYWQNYGHWIIQQMSKRQVMSDLFGYRF